jgi:ABC-type transport system involved in cytochrome c biogenesis ATPase subunit
MRVNTPRLSSASEKVYTGEKGAIEGTEGNGKEALRVCIGVGEKEQGSSPRKVQRRTVRRRRDASFMRMKFVTRLKCSARRDDPASYGTYRVLPP